MSRKPRTTVVTAPAAPADSDTAHLEESTVTTDTADLTTDTDTATPEPTAPESTDTATPEPTPEPTADPLGVFTAGLDQALSTAHRPEPSDTEPEPSIVLPHLDAVTGAYRALKGAQRNKALNIVATRLRDAGRSRDWDAMDAVTAVNDALVAPVTGTTAAAAPADPYAEPVRRMVALYLARDIADSGVTLGEGLDPAEVIKRATERYAAVTSLSDEQRAQVVGLFGGSLESTPESERERSAEVSDALAALRDGYALATGSGVGRKRSGGTSTSRAPRDPGAPRNDVRAVIAEVLSTVAADGSAVPSTRIAKVANGGEDGVTIESCVTTLTGGAVSAALASQVKRSAAGDDSDTWETVGGPERIGGVDGPLSARLRSA